MRPAPLWLVGEARRRYPGVTPAEAAEVYARAEGYASADGLAADLGVELRELKRRLRVRRSYLRRQPPTWLPCLVADDAIRRSAEDGHTLQGRWTPVLFYTLHEACERLVYDERGQWPVLELAGETAEGDPWSVRLHCV